jgi:hypothetical protein
MNTTKKQLGQFFSTNCQYILQDLNIPDDCTIVEPFCGNGDLIQNINKEKLECYDIDSKHSYIIQQDTLLNPPIYTNKFIITNPPYLARNKNKDKTICDKYNQNDLYKCFISNLLTNKCNGGIIIIPVNFWCSIRKNDIELRKSFLNIYKIILLNIFEESVFDDTKYAVCSFQFQLITDNTILENIIPTIIYPQKDKYNFTLNELNNYTIGGEIYNLQQNKNIKIERLTTNILIKCIDNNINDKIKLLFVDDNDIYVDNTEKLSARSFASMTIEPLLSIEKQKLLIEKFNTYLETQRKKYNSLFLSNYREANSMARKRISFNLVFNIINYLLNEINQE